MTEKEKELIQQVVQKTDCQIDWQDGPPMKDFHPILRSVRTIQKRRNLYKI